MNTKEFKLTRNAAGRLVLTGAQGDIHAGIVPGACLSDQCT